MDEDKKKKDVISRRSLLKKAAVGGAVIAGAGIAGLKSQPDAMAAGGNGELAEVAKKRHLSPDELLAAAKTYEPDGVHDPYICISSGGQSGQLLVYGVPSMRLIKVVGVFTPEPWQGYGFDDSEKILYYRNQRRLRWGICIYK